MFPNIEKFPINWENGMKLSSDYFHHLEDSIEDSIRDTRAFTIQAIGNFGLLPNSAFEIQNSKGIESNSVRVSLKACRALLPGGNRVEIISKNIEQLQIPLEAPFVEFAPSSNTKYHVFLCVDSNERVKVGIPKTRPIRLSYMCPDYRLEYLTNDKFKSIANVVSPNRMKIAEWKDGKLSEAYIPACLAIKGFPLLERWYVFFKNQIENIIRLGISIVGENRNKYKAKCEFCIPIIHYLRMTKGYFDWKLPQESPVELAVYFGNLAGLLKGTLETGDRDFVRNYLKNGNVNNLIKYIDYFLSPKAINREGIAETFSIVSSLIKSLIDTLVFLSSNTGPIIKDGDRNLSAG